METVAVADPSLMKIWVGGYRSEQTSGVGVVAGGRGGERKGRENERAIEMRGKPMVALGGRPAVVLASCYGYGGVRANGNVVFL